MCQDRGQRRRTGHVITADGLEDPSFAEWASSGGFMQSLLFLAASGSELPLFFFGLLASERILGSFLAFFCLAALLGLVAFAGLALMERDVAD
jgi:hypothetical protein